MSAAMDADGDRLLDADGDVVVEHDHGESGGREDNEAPGPATKKAKIDAVPEEEEEEEEKGKTDGDGDGDGDDDDDIDSGLSYFPSREEMGIPMIPYDEGLKMVAAMAKRARARIVKDIKKAVGKGDTSVHVNVFDSHHDAVPEFYKLHKYAIGAHIRKKVCRMIVSGLCDNFGVDLHHRSLNGDYEWVGARSDGIEETWGDAIMVRVAF